ncbi:MAG: YwaF family protein [Firmicutes bacterium]|nr:YwaF family protein [Bacillota bacterium]MCL2256515.1 YwaF family protein [Bacillota bacterium]
MNYFFGFDVYFYGRISWMFNLNHLMLIFVVVGILCAMYFGLHAKSKRGVFVTKITLAVLMFVLETGRISWNLAHHFHSNEYATFANFDWWWRISFSMCAIMKWFSIATLLLSAFLRKDNRAVTVMKNIMFGCALVGAALAFVYPDMISTSRSLLHFISVQTIISHFLLIFVPLYFIKIGELKVEIKNMWMVLLGYVYIGSVAMSAAQIAGRPFSFMLNQPLLESIGLNIGFPWHIMITFGVVFSISTAIYGGFEIARLIKKRKEKEKRAGKVKEWLKGLLKPPVILKVLTFAIALALFFTIPLTFENFPVLSWVGLVCLAPILFSACGVLISDFLQQKEAKKKHREIQIQERLSRI